jgi:hypothetical protein
MRHINHEMLNAVTERAERLRDYTPEEEFDETTASLIAKREVEPFFDGENSSGGIDLGN